ncbi:MAG: hypothetical protein LBR44_00910 [Clostridiales Family XIII bacterium]|jgi:predicted ABC-type ATPase|nr:hypothetical protein [Clostridiales Family XIII bacterium]
MPLKTEQPVLTVFAGPNGSGKSTITQRVVVRGLYINADDIMQRSGCSDLKAAQEAEKIREHCLREKLDFAFETVLSTSRNLDLIARARGVGYFIDGYFILTVDPELNVQRIKCRVLSGGHAVPPGKTRERYAKSLRNLPRLIELCDRIKVVDNTDLPRVIFVKEEERQVVSPNRYWSPQEIQALTGCAPLR